MKKLNENKKDSDVNVNNGNILLAMLPYWDPLIPPQGIAHLKTYLRYHGFRVKTADANTEEEFKELYDLYFGLLRKYVPGSKQGNFYNIGHDVLRNHMLAHFNRQKEEDYLYVVKEIIYQTFFTPFTNEQVGRLGEILTGFYSRLEKYILDLLERERPSVFGISVLRDTAAASLFSFKLAKERYPHIRTVMGGSIFSDHLLVGTPNFDFFLEKTPYIDNIIIGEGQLLLLKMLRGELPASKKVYTVEDIDGERLGFSSLNVPDLSDFNVRDDYPYLAAQASTSCPFQCSFCNVVTFFGKYRRKEPAKVVEEMTAMSNQYGVQLFFMNDALLNYTATDLSDEMIKKGRVLYWDGYLKVSSEVCDFETTLNWRRGGYYRARLGVESGSQHVLDLMDKRITIDQTRKALFSLANAGIKTTTYWVIGHPGETEEDFRKTLELLEEQRNYIYEAECNPFIFGYQGQGKSELWENKRKLLYPPEAKDMLMIQSWTVDDEPSRQETYRRVSRFVQHCNKLGIPNPYSMIEIYQADERWKKMHKNAVPNLVDFKEKGCLIDDTHKVEALSRMQNTLEEEGDFGF